LQRPILIEVKEQASAGSTIINCSCRGQAGPSIGSRRLCPRWEHMAHVEGQRSAAVGGLCRQVGAAPVSDSCAPNKRVAGVPPYTKAGWPCCAHRPPPLWLCGRGFRHGISQPKFLAVIELGQCAGVAQPSWCVHGQCQKTNLPALRAAHACGANHSRNRRLAGIAGL